MRFTVFYPSQALAHASDWSAGDHTIHCRMTVMMLMIWCM